MEVDLDSGSTNIPNLDHPIPPAFKFKATTSKTKLKTKLDGPHTDPTPTPTADTELDPFPQTLELPRALVVSGLEHAGMPAQRALVEVLRERRAVFDSTSSSKDAGGEERGTDTPDEDLNEVLNLPDGFIMVYVCPWDPRERPAIHKSLVGSRVTCFISFSRRFIAFSFDQPSLHSSTDSP